jgi:sialic acid synthase SpsE
MKKPDQVLRINETLIGDDFPTYFIADVAANHDGDIERAKDLIYLAAERGADAAKFQHFSAETIVSDQGFRALDTGSSHQSKWDKSVFDVYKAASVDLSWTEVLKDTCDKAGIAFFTSPYSEKLADHIDPFVPAHKIGSGDITWLEMIKFIAAKGKPTLLASGASSFDDVVHAMNAALEINSQICLMQCNTNYTASLENFKYIQLNVLKAYRQMYPSLVLGLSDHTPGHATVLGAVALGARMIEKHLTDDNDREGPDHKFSMNGDSWQEMVERTRELENSLGNGIKRVEKNEKETVILQRRSVCCSRELAAGHILTDADLEVLRPCPLDAILPRFRSEIVGKSLTRDLRKGESFKWQDLSSQ